MKAQLMIIAAAYYSCMSWKWMKKNWRFVCRGILESLTLVAFLLVIIFAFSVCGAVIAK